MCRARYAGCDEVPGAATLDELVFYAADAKAPPHQGKRGNAEREAETGFVVNGRVHFNARGSVSQAYEPYFQGTSALAAVPDGTVYTTSHLDAMGRAVRTVHPGGAHGVRGWCARCSAPRKVG